MIVAIVLHTQKGSLNNHLASVHGGKKSFRYNCCTKRGLEQTCSISCCRKEAFQKHHLWCKLCKKEALESTVDTLQQFMKIRSVFNVTYVCDRHVAYYLCKKEPLKMFTEHQFIKEGSLSRATFVRISFNSLLLWSQE